MVEEVKPFFAAVRREVQKRASKQAGCHRVAPVVPSASWHEIFRQE
jgi:hypothetical protein